MSLVRINAEANAALIVSSPPGHPVGGDEVWYAHDGTLRVEVAREEAPLVVRRIDLPVGGGLDVLIGKG